MSGFDADDYERACRSWAATRPEELQSWRLLGELLRDRDGWTFVTGALLGQVPIGWCYGPGMAPRLVIRAEKRLFTAWETGLDDAHHFASATELLDWLERADEPQHDDHGPAAGRRLARAAVAIRRTPGRRRVSCRFAVRRATAASRGPCAAVAAARSRSAASSGRGSPARRGSACRRRTATPGAGWRRRTARGRSIAAALCGRRVVRPPTAQCWGRRPGLLRELGIARFAVAADTGSERDRLRQRGPRRAVVGGSGAGRRRARARSPKLRHARTTGPAAAAGGIAVTPTSRQPDDRNTPASRGTSRHIDGARAVCASSVLECTVGNQRRCDAALVGLAFARARDAVAIPGSAAARRGRTTRVPPTGATASGVSYAVCGRDAADAALRASRRLCRHDLPTSIGQHPRRTWPVSLASVPKRGTQESNLALRFWRPPC